MRDSDTTTTPAAAGPDDRLTQAEAGRLAGVSRQHVHRLLREGRLRDVGIRGAPRVSRAELLARYPHAGREN
jgi:hypothetical protein